MLNTIFSVASMVGAILTVFLGIAAITNARRINQKKHHEHAKAHIPVNRLEVH